MTILTTPGWEGYELLDTGNGMRLERFGKYRLVRPDPQAIWQPHRPQDEWLAADAVYNVYRKEWDNKNNVPQKWLMHYKDLSFWAELTPFKHTGVFPEQILQWDWIEDKLRIKNQEQKTVKVLNLFGYTGIASLVAAHAGAVVTHIDASRPTIAWARENQAASGLETKPIRWILEDAIKFVQREVKRGNTYDAIIMDPPVYGHGPNGEKWDFTESFPELLSVCRQVLSPKPVFILINAYAISASSLMLENVLKDFVPTQKSHIEVGELAIEEQGSGRLLSTGIFGRWSSV
ncbi:MAG: class I SAM-dependent methyltransferase [Candidatus Levybacteria bacterium]|nr:class I SAM-dependent methyltransferase [Candidatus Levybacteria bacterium]